MWVVVLVVAKLGDNLATGMVRPALVDEGYSFADIGWMVGGVGFAASLAGALIGGSLVRPLGGKRALITFTALQACAVTGYFLVFAGGGDENAMTTVVAADHLFGGMATAALFTHMMDACGTEHSATDYTVQASIVVAATGAGGAASGFVATALGYSSYFLVGSVASFLCLFAMVFAVRQAAPLFAPSEADSKPRENDN